MAVGTGLVKSRVDQIIRETYEHEEASRLKNAPIGSRATCLRRAHPHLLADSPEREGIAQARAASCSDRQMQCLTLAPIVGITGFWREHESKRINDVGPRLFPRTPLAKDTGYLRNRRHHPTFLVGLIDDRQVKLLGHTANDTQRPGGIQ